MVIDYLASHPEFVATLARDISEHYRSITSEETFATRCAKLRRHMNENSLPIALVAYAGEELLGTAALREEDLEGYEDLTPWLGGVFVRSEHRGRGIASALCRAIEEKAWLMSFSVLYLFTMDKQQLYAGLGWQHLQGASWRGRRVDIMTKRRPKA